MSGKNSWVLLSMAILMGCAMAGGSGAETYLTPIELNKNPSAYDHKHVVVKGWLEYGFEQRHLFQSVITKEESEGKAPVDDPACTSIEVPETLRSRATKLNHRYVLIEGLFLSDLAGERVFLGLCSTTGIQVESIKPAP